jgi:hypothetical protein
VASFSLAFARPATSSVPLLGLAPAAESAPVVALVEEGDPEEDAADPLDAVPAADPDEVLDPVLAVVVEESCAWVSDSFASARVRSASSRADCSAVVSSVASTCPAVT